MNPKRPWDCWAIDVAYWGAVMALAVVLWLLFGCTVRPKVVTNSQASFDGNAPNSGLLGIDADGNRVVTPHAAERYRELMRWYGKIFIPPVQPGEGIVDTGTNAFLLDSQHWFYFLTANRRAKAAKQ